MLRGGEHRNLLLVVRMELSSWFSWCNLQVRRLQQFAGFGRVRKRTGATEVYTVGGRLVTRPAVSAARRTTRAESVFTGGETSSASRVTARQCCSLGVTAVSLGVPRAVYMIGGCGERARAREARPGIKGVLIGGGVGG